LKVERFLDLTVETHGYSFRYFRIHIEEGSNKRYLCFKDTRDIVIEMIENSDDFVINCVTRQGHNQIPENVWKEISLYLVKELFKKSVNLRLYEIYKKITFANNFYCA
jgi:hypothetical protein